MLRKISKLFLMSMQQILDNMHVFDRLKNPKINKKSLKLTKLC